MARREAEDQVTKSKLDSETFYKPQEKSSALEIASGAQETPEEIAKRPLFGEPKATSSLFQSLFNDKPLFAASADGASKEEASKSGGISGSLFGGAGLFGNSSEGSSLFVTSTSGTLFGGQNPFANYNLANLRKDGAHESEEEGEEEEKRPPSPAAYKEEESDKKEPSPYNKLIAIKVLKFKVDKVARGEGTVSIEEPADKIVPLALVIFRNNVGAVIFQGQLLKNVSKLIKKTTQKNWKIKRVITVVAKKEAGQGVVRCGISFKDDSDCLKFKETFNKVVAGLPEIIKATTPQTQKKAEEKKEEAKSEKK